MVDDVKPSIKRAKDEAKCLRVAIALVSGRRQSGMLSHPLAAGEVAVDVRRSRAIRERWGTEEESSSI